MRLMNALHEREDLRSLGRLLSLIRDLGVLHGAVPHSSASASTQWILDYVMLNSRLQTASNVSRVLVFVVTSLGD